MSFAHVLDRLNDAARAVPKSEKQRGMRDNRIVSLKDLREFLHVFNSTENMARDLCRQNQLLKQEIEQLKREQKDGQHQD